MRAAATEVEADVGLPVGLHVRVALEVEIQPVERQRLALDHRRGTAGGERQRRGGHTPEDLQQRELALTLHDDVERRPGVGEVAGPRRRVVAADDDRHSGPFGTYAAGELDRRQVLERRPARDPEQVEVACGETLRAPPHELVDLLGRRIAELGLQVEHLDRHVVLAQERVEGDKVRLERLGPGPGAAEERAGVEKQQAGTAGRP